MDGKTSLLNALFFEKAGAKTQRLCALAGDIVFGIKSLQTDISIAILKNIVLERIFVIEFVFILDAFNFNIVEDWA